MSVEPLTASNPAYSIFEYLYRDAANYKAWGSVLLNGEVRRADLQTLMDCLEDTCFFVAEQVGVPVLYEMLYLFSDGETEDDHALHEFVGLRSATQAESATLPLWGSVEDLLRAFDRAKGQWNVMLSQHAVA